MVTSISLPAATTLLPSLSHLHFKRSELTGLTAALKPPPPLRSSLRITCPLVVQPLASRVCKLTGKRANNGYKISFSHHRTKKLQHVNLQYKRLWWEEGKRFVRLRLSTKALKTIERKGLDAMAREAGINLNAY